MILSLRPMIVNELTFIFVWSLDWEVSMIKRFSKHVMNVWYSTVCWLTKKMFVKQNWIDFDNSAYKNLQFTLCFPSNRHSGKRSSHWSKKILDVLKLL